MYVSSSLCGIPYDIATLWLLRFGACELIDLIEQKTTPREFSRVSRTKGHLSKRTAFVREIVKEVSGYAICTTSS